MLAAGPWRAICTAEPRLSLYGCLLTLACVDACVAQPLYHDAVAVIDRDREQGEYKVTKQMVRERESLACWSWLSLAVYVYFLSRERIRCSLRAGGAVSPVRA